MKKYMLNEADRREIARLLSQNKSAPPPNPIAESQKVKFEEGDSYWALPPCETGLPAADIIDGQVSTVGIQCCLFRHVWGEDELEQMKDMTGNPIRVTVYNYYTRPENGLIQVYKHKDGSWTNERPEPSSVPTVNPSQPTTQPPLQPDPTCQNECKWQADANGVWQLPTGGCDNGTTTSTTSTTAGPTTTGDPGGGGQPGTTFYPDSQPPTLAPCINTKCTLVCVDTSTTPGPDEFGVPVPYSRFKYELKEGSVCPEGCTCYGLGEPCYLVEGELISNCIGEGPTTTSTTTPGADAPVCAQAEFIFGTVPPNYWRAAIDRHGIAGEWTVCKGCDPGTVPLFPLGGEPYRQHDWPLLANVYETPCVKTPCAEPLAPTPTAAGQAIYRAYHWDQQFAFWGPFVGDKFYDRFNKRFQANWFLCTPCVGRPEVPPPFWIYEDAAVNAANGIEFDQASNTYIYRSRCTQGYDCGTCRRARARRERPIQYPDGQEPTTTGIPTSTTTSTSTTPRPCGCERPAYCPQPFECTKTRCVRGGEIVGGQWNTSTSSPPALPCFADYTTTTTSTTTVGPGTSTTTLGPGFCVNDDGSVCDCNSTSTTTVPPSGSTCPPGCIYRPPAPPADPNCTPGTCDCGPGGPGREPTTSEAPPFCNGWCDWKLVGVGADSRWQLVNYGCLGSGPACNCSAPDPDPDSLCGATRITPCKFGTLGTSPPGGGSTLPPGPPRPPCSCCNDRPTTTLSPCFTGGCRYTATSDGRWALRSNTCITACPCADPSRITVPSQPCDTLSLACGQSPPTRPPTSTSAPTTTLPPPGACCLRIVNGAFQCIGSVSSASNCQGYVTNNPTVYTSAVFFAGQACGDIVCGGPTTEAPGACCFFIQIGTAAPVSQCFNVINAETCAGLLGTFKVGQVCGGSTCDDVTTTTTTAGPTTTTTTNDPSVSCCYENGQFLICSSGIGSSACIQQGGRVVPTCSDCVSSTTTDPPCTCYARQCGCSTGPDVICTPGTEFNCDSCSCVGPTTTTTSTTTSTTTTTPAPTTLPPPPP